MSNLSEIRLNKADMFKNHKQQCRLCLENLTNDQDNVKITKFIDSQFFSFTLVHLNASQKFSQKICSHCHQALNEFTIQRNDWIFKQSQLEEFVKNDDPGTLLIKEEFVDNPQQDTDVKIESDDDDSQIVVEELDDECNDDLVVIEPMTSTPKALKRKIVDENPIDLSTSEKHPEKPPKKKSRRSIKADASNTLDTNQNESKTWETSEDQGNLSRWQRERYLRIHQCLHCNKSFQHLHMLDTHRLKAHPETVSDEEAKRILKRARMGTMKICQECGIELPSRQMASHMLKHRNKNYCCDICNYRTVKHSHMQAHMLKHVKKREKFMCHLCPNEYARRHGLVAHIKQAHTEAGKIYKCQNESCGMEFDSHSKWHRHRYYECGDKGREMVLCPHCSKEVSKKNLRDHLRPDFEDRDKIFICSECNLKLPNKKCFNHHQMLHKGEVYYCDFTSCNKCFSSHAAYTRHLETHQSDKSFKCPYEGCDKSFAKSQSMNVHIAIKHENYRKKCPIESCPFETGFNLQMKNHIVGKHPDLSDQEKEMYLAHIKTLKLLY